MAIKYFRTKQPYDSYPISFNFTDWCKKVGETISTYTLAAIDKADNSNVKETVMIPAKETNDIYKVYAWVRAGTTGHAYRFKCQVVGTKGSQFELEGEMKVKEE